MQGLMAVSAGGLRAATLPARVSGSRRNHCGGRSRIGGCCLQGLDPFVGNDRLVISAFLRYNRGAVQPAIGNQHAVALLHLVLHAEVAPEDHVARLDHDQPVIVVHMRCRTHLARLHKSLAVDPRAFRLDAPFDVLRMRAVAIDSGEPAQLLAEIPACACGKLDAGAPALTDAIQPVRSVLVLNLPERAFETRAELTRTLLSACDALALCDQMRTGFGQRIGKCNRFRLGRVCCAEQRERAIRTRGKRIQQVAFRQTGRQIELPVGMFAPRQPDEWRDSRAGSSACSTASK